MRPKFEVPVSKIKMKTGLEIESLSSDSARKLKKKQKMKKQENWKLAGVGVGLYKLASLLLNYNFYNLHHHGIDRKIWCLAYTKFSSGFGVRQSEISEL